MFAPLYRVNSDVAGTVAAREAPRDWSRRMRQYIARMISFEDDVRLERWTAVFHGCSPSQRLSFLAHRNWHSFLFPNPCASISMLRPSCQRRM